MPITLAAAAFLQTDSILLDSRSPGEYAAGHIPGAISFPLFDNDERAQIGTCYKQISPEAAIELGLEIIGPKMVGLVRQAKQLAPDRRVRLHCWRGGMRSQSLAWLLETAGFQVTLLDGGYKGFRRWLRSTLAIPRPVLTLGGMTGTGKTLLLGKLQAQGELILDLEHWANHRGSSYGAVGLPPQPTQEQFDNLLGLAWAKLDPDRPVWIEAESRRIGLCRIPDEVFQLMLTAPILQVERSIDERLDILEKEYGDCDRQALISATERITKRIGGQNAQATIAAIQTNDLRSAMALVLDYYDKTYQYDIERRQVSVYSVDAIGLTDPEIVNRLMVLGRSLIANVDVSC
jgi:tRNA 2-selenouridine synthase